jgi:hypothetical protein
VKPGARNAIESLLYDEGGSISEGYINSPSYAARYTRSWARIGIGELVKLFLLTVSYV